MKYIIIVLLSFILFACNTIKEEIDKPDKIFYEGQYRVECYKFGKVCDSLLVFDCKIIDTISNSLYYSGYHVEVNPNELMPIEWISYWDENGNITDEVEYIFNCDMFKVVINQNIKFGNSRLDTIYSESSFITHQLEYIGDDSVRVKIWYRGTKEDESNFAFESSDEDSKFLYRTKKPYISFNLPKSDFKDSILSFHLIQTYDHTESGGGTMSLKRYNISL